MEDEMLMECMKHEVKWLVAWDIIEWKLKAKETLKTWQKITRPLT
jgi:hypothetical protein